MINYFKIYNYAKFAAFIQICSIFMRFSWTNQSQSGSTISSMCWDKHLAIHSFYMYIRKLWCIISIRKVLRTFCPNTYYYRAGSEKMKPLCDMGVKNSNCVYLYNVFNFQLWTDVSKKKHYTEDASFFLNLPYTTKYHRRYYFAVVHLVLSVRDELAVHVYISSRVQKNNLKYPQSGYWKG